MLRSVITSVTVPNGSVVEMKEVTSPEAGKVGAVSVNTMFIVPLNGPPAAMPLRIEV